MTRLRPRACWRRERLKRSAPQICSVLRMQRFIIPLRTEEQDSRGQTKASFGKNRKELVRNTLYLTPRTRQHRPSETKVYKAPCKYARFTATDRVDIWTATGCLLAWAKCITATRTSVRPRPSQKRRLGRPLQQQWIGCLNLGINTQTRNWLDVWHSTGL